MNMSRSRFGWGGAQDNFSQKPFYCGNTDGHTHTRTSTHTLWEETKQLFVQQLLAPAVEKWLNSRNIPKNNKYIIKNK